MKCKLLLLSLFSFTQLFAQNVPVIAPSKIVPLVFEGEFAKKLNSDESLKKCDEVWKQLEKEKRSPDQLTPDEKKILKYCDETKRDIWDIIGIGCSWYCGSGPKQVIASSQLQPQAGNNYSAYQVSDLNYKTAWVEGVAGDGVGESITFNFTDGYSDISKIIVVNGYVKNLSAWKNNSRVKKLKLYVNGKFHSVLALEDSRSEQVFNIQIEHFGSNACNKFISDIQSWCLKFEIAEVYKGDKYEDTVLTEIYFDGTRSH